MLRRLAAAPFEALVAALAIISTLGQIATGTAGAVAVALPGWLVTGWQISYLAAGVLVLFGLATGRVAVEACGLMWLAGVVVVNVVSIVAVSGPDRLLLLPTYLGVAAACVVRTWTLLAGADVTLLPRGRHD